MSGNLVISAQLAACSPAARSASAARLAGRVVVMLAIVIAPAMASNGDLPAPGRYDMHPSPDGVLRLDRVTGEIALCAETEEAEGWTCRTVVAGSSVEPAGAETAAAPAGEGSAGDRRVRAEAARERAREAGREAARRLAVGAPTAGTSRPPTATEADAQNLARGGTRAELDRLRQENARLSARVDELERRLTHVAALAGTDVRRADAETDEAIAGIDRAVRVGIYALARFRDLAETIGSDEPRGR